MHKDLWGYEEDRHRKRPSEEVGDEQKNEDRAVILALILLLLSDCPDEFLITALIYILS